MTNLCITTQEGVAIDDCHGDMKSVLLVDDNQPFLYSLQARAILSTVPIDLVISDVTMPMMDGL